MITEAYVSFETAKLLKEKGFDEICYLGYDRNGEYVPTSNRTNSQIIQPDFCFICCPTQQMAMRWLREVRNIKVNVFYSNFNCYAIEYFETNTQTGVDESVFINEGYHVYEQAVEAAIKYCLENLI